MRCADHWKGIGVTLFVNWAVKPFSMALLAWIFIRHSSPPGCRRSSSILRRRADPARRRPCTAMVFVWSRLTKGDPSFTLSQVALNDTIMIFAFAPIVGLLLGLSAIAVPWDTLLISVLLYIVIPVAIAQVLRAWLAQGDRRASTVLDGALHAWSLRAAADAGAAVRLPGRAILDQPLIIALLAVPILIQVFFNSALAYWLNRVRRGTLRGRPLGADRGLELLRAGGGRGHLALRL
jgi:arsenite transporter